MNSKAYLIAAREVLAKVGRPMHYESIADLALKFGLLKTKCKTPRIAMGARISQDIAKNPSSIFLRKARGVYTLREVAPFASDRGLLISSWTSIRVERLRRKLGFPDRVAVLRRALYLYRRALDVQENDQHVRLRGEAGETDLGKLSIGAVATRALQLGLSVRSKSQNSLDQQRSSGREKDLELPRDLQRLAVRLKGRGGRRNISEVLDLCVMLLEIACRLASNSGAIEIRGLTRVIRIQIIAR